MSRRPSLVLFRRDLRIGDNPALAAAAAQGAPIIPVFILDGTEPFAPGGAAKWWLHYSLERISEALKGLGARLILRRGGTIEETLALVSETGADRVFWNRRYSASEIAIDGALMARLESEGVVAKSYSAHLLREPWEAKTKSGGPFRVFTPFWKALQSEGPSRALVRQARVMSPPDASVRSDTLPAWGLLPSNPDWAAEFSSHWTPGEGGARAALDAFLDGAAGRYDAERDRPDLASTSRLSPHLAFGEISPVEIWGAVQARIAAGELSYAGGTKFLSELAWREFSYHLLFHNPRIDAQPLRREFDAFPWRNDAEQFRAWKRGLTGYPIVDAGMRQLWRTGWMHNRVRMICASFLVKYLLIPWQKGAAWFLDTLVDADPANNSASWQWVAGCGADAAPYFRIFNPVLQGEKFDPAGDYVRAFVPELARMPSDFIHKPWSAPQSILSASAVVLGETYPLPIVDHSFARERALSAFASLKAGADA